MWKQRLIAAWCFTVILTQLSVKACLDFPTFHKNTTTNLPRPNLTLQFDEHVKEKFIHYLDSNTLLVNMTGATRSLRWDCWAPYPIDLKFAGHLTNQEATVKTFRKEYVTAEGSQSCFLINATMGTYEQITGNYTCSSIENPRLSTSYYIFASPSLPGVLLTRGQHIILQLKPEQEAVTLPCAISNPEIEVKLLKDNVEIQRARDVRFNPKLGFRVKLTPDDPLKMGNYSCQTKLSRTDRVDITLLPPENFKGIPAEDSIRLPKGGQLNISCYGADNFVIVTFPEDLPVVKNEVSLVDSSLPRHRYKYVGGYISGQLPAGKVGYVECKWNQSTEPFARWTFSVDDKEAQRSGRFESKMRQVCGKNPKKDLVLFECSNSVECRMNTCVRKDPTCRPDQGSEPCREINKKHCMNNGLIQCVRPTAPVVVEMFFTGFANSSVHQKPSRWSAPLQDEHLSEDIVREMLLLKYTPKSSSAHFDPKMIRLSCQGSSFVFASGFRWSIKYADGKQLEIKSGKEEELYIRINHQWGHSKSELESVLTMPLTPDTEKISSFVCEAPVWNSWKWMSQTISMKTVKHAMAVEIRERNKKPGKSDAAWSTAVLTKLLISSLILHLVY